MIAGVLVGLLIALAVASPLVGSSGVLELGDVLQGIGAMLGLAEPLDSMSQRIVELRLMRMLTTCAVGAALALSGALLQGVFRNDLASPSLLGVSSGASLGASIAVLLMNGYGPLYIAETSSSTAPFLVCGAAFLGAVIVTALVTLIATSDGRISIPMLLLVGIAMNALAGALLFAIQAYFLDDFEVTRALIAWSFGTLNDRLGFHAGLIIGTVCFSLFILPFVATELDLFATGEEDARALGVDTSRVKLLALGAAALVAAVAVAVAGTITFVGLIVPHVLRLLPGVGRSTSA